MGLIPVGVTRMLLWLNPYSCLWSWVQLMV